MARSRRKSDPEVDPERMKKVLRVLRGDADLFARKVLRATPSKQQTQLLKAVSVPNARVSVKSGHGTGKTSALGMVIPWFLLCFPRSKVGCTAPTKRQLADNLWSEVRTWMGRAPVWFQRQLDIKAERINVKGKPTQFAVAKTAKKEDPEALQGLHAPNMLFLVDEGSGVHDAIFDPIRGTLTTEGARMVLAGNPTRNTGFFFETHNRDRDKWHCLTFSGKDSPFVEDSYIEEMEEIYGPDSDFVRVRILGEFPSQGVVQVIPRELAEEASRREIRVDDYSFAPKVLACDPAWEGDDRTVIALRQGLKADILHSYQQINTPTLAGVMARLIGEHKPSGVFIDAGMGTGLIDGLRSLGLNPTPVFFGEGAFEKRFLNRRAQMWWNMREWLENGGVIPERKTLITDLTGPEYGFTMKGKIQLERKKDMKTRGLASPDEAEAIALTFAHPVESVVLSSQTASAGELGSFAQGAGFDVLEGL